MHRLLSIYLHTPCHPTPLSLPRPPLPTDFANLAEACAALWGEPTAGSQSGSRSSSGSGEIGSSGSGNGSGAHEAGIPAAVTTLLEVVAGEVRTELANKVRACMVRP